MSTPTNKKTINFLSRANLRQSPRLHILGLAATIALATIIAGAFAALSFARPSAAAQSAADKAKSSHTEPANAERGEKLFVSYGCYECHGRAAQGGVGPSLGPNPLPLAFIEKYVRHPTGSMPPYTEKTVSDQDLADIVAYLKSLPEPPKAKDIPLLSE